jgi:hypothetical protein
VHFRPAAMGWPRCGTTTPLPTRRSFQRVVATPVIALEAWRCRGFASLFLGSAK